MGCCSAALIQKYVKQPLTNMVGCVRTVKDRDRPLLTAATRLRCSIRISSAISVRRGFVVERNVIDAATKPARDALA